MDSISDTVKWANNLAEVQKRGNWAPADKKILMDNRENRDRCVDNAQFRFPLILLDVLLEDILIDSGSMYNAISLKAFYKLAGTFPSFYKAFNMTCWDTKFKRVQVVGGGETPILGTVRLDATTSKGETVPLYWAVYPDEDHIIILGTPGMRALNFECKSEHLNDINLFKPKRNLPHVASAMYMPILTEHTHESNKIYISEQPSTSQMNNNHSSSSSDVSDSEVEAILASNPSTVKYIADCYKASSYVTPEEHNGLMGGAILKAALENKQPTRELADQDDMQDFIPENLLEDEDFESQEGPLAIAVRRSLEDFQLDSQSPRPPDYDL